MTPIKDHDHEWTDEIIESAEWIIPPSAPDPNGEKIDQPKVFKEGTAVFYHECKDPECDAFERWTV